MITHELKLLASSIHTIFGAHLGNANAQKQMVEMLQGYFKATSRQDIRVGSFKYENVLSSHMYGPSGATMLQQEASEYAQGQRHRFAKRCLECIVSSTQYQAVKARIWI